MLTKLGIHVFPSVLWHSWFIWPSHLWYVLYWRQCNPSYGFLVAVTITVSIIFIFQLQLLLKLIAITF